MIISTFALKLCDVGRRRVKAQGSTKTSNNVHWGTETCLHLHIPLPPPPQRGPYALLASSPPLQTSSAMPSSAFPIKWLPHPPRPKTLNPNLSGCHGLSVPTPAGKPRDHIQPQTPGLTIHFRSHFKKRFQFPKPFTSPPLPSFPGFHPCCKQQSIRQPGETSPGTASVPAGELQPERAKQGTKDGERPVHKATMLALPKRRREISHLTFETDRRRVKKRAGGLS